VIVKRSWRQVGPDEVTAVPPIDQLKAEVPRGTPAAQLGSAVELAERFRVRGDELLDQFVDAARAGGASWSEIGCGLGTSKQAAQQRFAALADPPPGQAPFGLTGIAAHVLSGAAARARARELGHHNVWLEHIVLGLLAQPEELAAGVLGQLGVTLQRARRQVEERFGAGRSRPSGSLGAAPQTKRLLELSRAIAKSLGSRCPKTEHILLAAISPKLQSPAATLLADCGVTPDELRDQLTRTLLHEASELAERMPHRPLRFRMRSL
jgi:hypothetical protein